MSNPTYKGTVLSMHVKCSDMYSHVIRNETGILSEYSGYVPSIVPNEFGDYLTLDVDPYTGRILNWKPFRKAKQPRLKNGRFTSRRS